MNNLFKSNRVNPMSAAVEAKSLLKDIAGPLSLGETLKVVFPRIARKCGLSERRVKSIWHMQARAIRADELAAIKAAARKQEVIADETVSDRLLRVEQRLSAIDPDFYREHVAALRHMAGRNRNKSN